MKNITKIILTIFTIVTIAWIWSRPNIFHPFSKHSAWEEGFKRATGMYPDEWNVKYHENVHE